MGWEKLRPAEQTAWAIAANQHGVIARYQLLGLGFSARAVEHRLATGRLHCVHRGIYALGRPQLTRYGRWMAAALSCGPHARLSHESAAALWEIRLDRRAMIDVSVPAHVARHRSGIRVHRRSIFVPEDLMRHHGIPVTAPVSTLVDLATRLRADQLEAAINEADKRDLISPEALRLALDELVRRPGVAALPRCSTGERSRSRIRSSSDAFCRWRGGQDYRSR